MAASAGQPLSSWWQPDPGPGEGLLDRPLGDAEFGSQLWDAQAGVAAGLQVAAQVGEPEALGAVLKVAGAAVVDRKPGAGCPALRPEAGFFAEPPPTVRRD